MSDVQTLTAKFRAAVGESSGLGKTIKFDFGSDGAVFIDGKSAPNVVDNRADAADCIVSIKLADFIAITEGKLDSMAAFMQGKMKVTGDMSVAQRLTPLLKNIA